MLKKIGVLALMLCGVGLVHPTAARAQEYGGRHEYAPQYRGDGRYYHDRDGFREEHREREWREQERRDRRWREQEWREHERWERRGYRSPYGYPPPAYYRYSY